MTKFTIESFREALVQIRVEQSQYITESISELEKNKNFDRQIPHSRAVISAVAHAAGQGYEYDSTKKSKISNEDEHSIIPLKHKKTGETAEMMVNGSHPKDNPNYSYTLDIHDEDGKRVHSRTFGGEEGKRKIPDQPNRSGKINPRLR